jgi:hypothetical protein
MKNNTKQGNYEERNEGSERGNKSSRKKELLPVNEER